MTGGGVGGWEGCRWSGGECSWEGDLRVDLDSLPLGECPKRMEMTAIKSFITLVSLCTYKYYRVHQIT